MNTHSPKPEPTGLDSTVSGNSSLPSPGVASPAEQNSTLTPPPQKSLREQLTVPDPHAEAPALRLPRSVGKHRLLEEILAGGMGVVYKAHDTELDRIVALKMIKGGVLATDEEVLRFHQEARAIARLNHPNIVPVHEIGQEEGRLFFTMAFAWGGNLAQQQSRFVADPRGAVVLVEKIARAVQYAHQRGILHRDLKPANILFDEHGSPWVSDFGLAKLVDATQELTRAGQLLGTPSYMAPEQADGRADQISPQTDVWALGVLLYELLTGQRPFKGGSQEEQLQKVRKAEPPQPRSVNRSLDRELETVILKCLEKEPSRRYASAEALADDLARWQRGEPVLARRPSWVVRAGRGIGRFRRPAFQLGAVIVLFALLWLAWKIGSPLPRETPETKLAKETESVLARLLRDEKVTLISESGPPLASRWLPHGGGDVFHPRYGDNFFRLREFERTGMLELLSAAPERFRLRAQVRHSGSRDKEGTAPGAVGIYFAYGKHRADEVTRHHFFRATFNDRTPTVIGRAEAGPLSQLSLKFTVNYEMGPDSPEAEKTFFCDIQRFFPPAGKLQVMPWRRLKVEVAPEQIKTFWEGELIKSSLKKMRADGTEEEIDGCDPSIIVDRAAFQTGDKGLLPQPRHKSEPVRSGGLGLYVERGEAAFRFVEIEPLP